MSSKLKHWFKMPLIVMPVIIQDGKVLLGLRKNTGFMDGYYGLPGGKHDGHEPLKQAVAREVREEVGIICHPGDIEFKSLIHINNPHDDRGILPEMAYVVFAVNKFEGQIINAEPDKCEKVEFFPIDQLLVNITDLSRKCIEHAVKGVEYDEVGW